MTRNVTLTDANDPFTLATQTDALTINGRTWTADWDGALRRARTTSPLGRSVSQFLDATGELTRARGPGGHGDRSSAAR